MRQFLLPAAFWLAAILTLPAQPVSPTDTLFPFRITLVSPDSTQQLLSTDLLKTGQVTVLAFWLTTCFPCMLELDAYTKNYAAWQQQADFRLIAISTDYPNRFRHIGARLQEKKYPFEVWWDRYKGFSQVLPGELNGLPQVFIFDKDGRLVWRHRKYQPGDEQEMFAKVLELSARR